MLTATRKLTEDVLNQLRTVTGTLNAPDLRVNLFQNDFQPTPTSVVADFVVADFDGYAEVTPTAWTIAFQNASGVYQMDSTTVLVWDMTGATTPNTVFGYYVSKGSALYWAERFPVPIEMVSDDSHIGLVPRITLPSMNGSALVSG